MEFVRIFRPTEISTNSTSDSSQAAACLKEINHANAVPGRLGEWLTVGSLHIRVKSQGICRFLVLRTVPSSHGGGALLAILRRFLPVDSIFAGVTNLVPASLLIRIL